MHIYMVYGSIYLKFVQSSALFNELPTGCWGRARRIQPENQQPQSFCFSFSYDLLSQRRKQKPTGAVGASVSVRQFTSTSTSRSMARSNLRLLPCEPAPARSVM